MHQPVFFSVFLRLHGYHGKKKKNTNVVEGNLGKQSMREDYLRAVGSSRVFRVELKRQTGWLAMHFTNSRTLTQPLYMWQSMREDSLTVSSLY